MNISSIGSSAGMNRMSGMKMPTDDQIKDKLTKEFGEDAAKSVTKEDGSIDKAKLREFMQSQGLPFPGGGQGGFGGVGSLKLPSASELKSKLTEKYGESTANSVFNEDGSVNEKKLKNLFEEKGINPMEMANQSQGSQGLSNSFNADKILDLFKKENGEEEAKKITDENGQIDFQKLWGYVSSKMFGQYNQVQGSGQSFYDTGSLLNTQA